MPNQRNPLKQITYKKVEITGSNIKRTDKEASSPVLTITAKEIQRSGATTVAEYLRTVTVLGGGNTVDQNNLNSFSEGISTASLRGFGSASTLILLNGRRITPAPIANPNIGQSTAYDLNSIPLSMLERIDKLKDGASAIYGSDAIAGVINFITKSNFQGGSVSGTYSANHQGKFGNKKFAGGYGFGDLDVQGYNVLLSVDYSQRDRVAVKDANDNIEQDLYYASVRRHNPLGSSISDQAFFYKERTPNGRNFTTSGAASQITSGATAVVLNQLNCPDSQKLVGNAADHGLAASSVLIGRTFCNFDVSPYSEAQGASKDLAALTRATFKINSNLQAFAELNVSRGEKFYTGAPRTISGTAPSSVLKAGAFAGTYQPILAIGHPDNPYKDARAAVVYRFMSTNTDSSNLFKNLRLVTGLKGEFGGWGLEAGALMHRYTLDQTLNGMLYLPTAMKLMTENRSLASLNSDPTITKRVINKNESEMSQIDFRASRELPWLSFPGGSVGVALGAEVRREKMNLVPDADLQNGNIVGLANIIVEDARSIKSVFAEARFPFAKTFEMDFAGRFDSYPGFDTNFVPKSGFKWTPSSSFALRGTLGRGFRVPSLSQLSKKGVQSFASILDPLRCNENISPAQPKPGAEQADCSKSFSQSSGGSAVGLKPERSKTETLGAIWAPTKNFDAIVDYYKIRREDETNLMSAYDILRKSEYSNLVIRDQSQATWLRDSAGNLIPNSGPLLQINRPYYNQGATETSGLDIELNARNRFESGLEWSSKATLQYVISYRFQQNPGDFETNVVGAQAGLADWHISSGLDTPRVKASFSSTWTKNDHSVTGSVRFVDAVSRMRWSDNGVNYNPAFCHYDSTLKGANSSNATQVDYIKWFPDCKVPTWTVFGLSYSYTGVKNLTLSFNVQNLFNKKAGYDPTTTSITTGYNQSLHNNFGRVFSASATYKFD